MITYACIFKHSGTIITIDKGKQVHDNIVSEDLLVNDIDLGNALVEFPRLLALASHGGYPQCGLLFSV